MTRVLVSEVLLVLLAGAALAQTAATVPEFEVADIHASKPGAKSGGDFLPGGRLQLHAVTMKDLIALAWDLDGNRISGGESWLDSDRFDIVAKAPGNLSDDGTLRFMLRTLLAQRFKLLVHSEDRVLPVYALALRKQKPKLKDAAGSEKSECKMEVIEGIRTYSCHNMTMAGLAQLLRPVAAAYLDHPVVDLTGLKGSYDFTLAWTGRGRLRGTGNPGGAAADPTGATAPSSDANGGLTVFEAVTRQLGLELAPRKHPLPVIIVDHVDRTPSEN